MWTYQPASHDYHGATHKVVYSAHVVDGGCWNNSDLFVWVDCWSEQNVWLNAPDISGANAHQGVEFQQNGAVRCEFRSARGNNCFNGDAWTPCLNGECKIQIHARLETASVTPQCSW
jgi:hypothetical protein